jgi:hypothetical protein
MAMQMEQTANRGMKKKCWNFEIRSEDVDWIQFDINLRSAVLTPVKVSNVVFWVVMSRGVVGRYNCFGGIYRFHLQGEYRGNTFI